MTCQAHPPYLSYALSMSVVWVLLLGAGLLSVVFARGGGSYTFPTTTTIQPRPMSSMGIFKECCPDIPTILQDASMKACEPRDRDENMRRGIFTPTRASCISECACNMDGFITVNPTNGKSMMNLPALTNYLQKFSVGEWAPIVAQAQAGCLSKLPVQRPGDPTNCTSGCNAVVMCLSSHFISKCPAPNTTEPCMRRLARMKKVFMRNGINPNKTTSQLLYNIRNSNETNTTVLTTWTTITNMTVVNGTVTTTVVQSAASNTSNTNTNNAYGGNGSGGNALPTTAAPTTAATTTAAATTVAATTVATTTVATTTVVSS